jgi:hypothetical protein
LLAEREIFLHQAAVRTKNESRLRTRAEIG